MRTIEGVLFEPVGCLAEFPAGPFNEIAFRLFDRKKRPARSGSRSYWHLLNVIELAGKEFTAAEKEILETLELQAVEGASAYEDVMPALSELRSMHTRLAIASSLSGVAVRRFLDKFSLQEFFAEVWNRDNAGGIKTAPLGRAINSVSLDPQQIIFLSDTDEGLKVAKEAGVNSVLMMNYYEESRRLAMHDPAGGIVSLHELPDFIRLVAAENTR